MIRIILTYGGIAGAIVIGSMILGFQLSDGEGLGSSQLLGYSIMLVALSAIFVGIKQYRDRHLGGVIRFPTALLVGLGISAAAGIVYVIVWELYLGLTGSDFIGQYTDSHIAKQEAAGVTGAELEALRTQMEAMKENYANPLFRVPITFLEIFPVGLLISLVSAAILRNSNVLPARG